jgi:hypothetical protein
MKAVVRVVVLAALTLILPRCGGVQGCSQIAEKSTGPCRVGLPTYWEYNDAWRTQ